MTTVPYQFIKRGNLFITPVGPAISEVNYPTQTYTKPRDFSLWVRGRIEDPSTFQMDGVAMPPSLYQEVRKDLTRFSPVEVTRSAFQRSDHAYVGVIDSKGKPYYFALDSRGMSVREVPIDDERVWKMFDRLADQERAVATERRRKAADAEMDQMTRTLPHLMVKGPVTEAVKQISKTHADASPRQHTKAAKHHDKLFKKTGSQEHRHLADAHRFAAHVKRGGGAAFISMQDGNPTGAIFNTPAAGGRGKAKLVRFTKSDFLSKAEKHTGTMVALHISREIAEKIAIPGGEEPESMHITLAYLGKDLTEEQKSAALCAVRRVAQQHGPVKAMLGGVGRFSASHTSEGRDVVYLSVDSPDITNLRPKLIEELAAEGIAPSNAHGFVPHVTLQYIEQDAATPLKRFPPIPVEFPCISLTVADNKMQLPFTTPTMLVIKALPKKSKEEKVKKTPTKKASSKKAGAGGKTRYTYPNEKKGGGAGAPKAQPLPLVVVQHDDSKNANPSEFANQLGVSVRTLKQCADKLGRDGFAKFMRSRLKRFSAKHRLDPDYWGTLYDRLQPQENLGKSDSERLRMFAEHVKHVASSVEPDHEARFGPHKVFIDHAHDEMTKRGMATGTLSEFKEKLVAAHRAGHLTMARADLVAAMPQHRVSASETNAHVGTFHFITEVPHAPTDSHRDAVVSAAAARESSTHAHAALTKEAHMSAAIAHTRAGMAHQRIKDERTASRHFKESQKHLKHTK